MSGIHPSAIVAEEARIGSGVEIGPCAVIGPEAALDEGVRVLAHAVVDGRTEIGPQCVIHPFARVGGQTQDLKFKGGKPGVRVGARTTIREYVTINAATNDNEFTEVGEDCLIMAYNHIAHCCRLGRGVILTNACQVAGHVEIEDYAVVEGMCGIVQFTRIGRMAFVGGMSKVTKDVPPFMLGTGNPFEVRGINRVGMERRGVSEAVRRELKEAFRMLYRSDRSVSRAVEEIRAQGSDGEEIRHLLAFIESSKKGITRNGPGS
ncbi:acyl-ACP--UDP-N-acetylglucosamine O-acyltransferase [Kiritimatiella glycovorans]|uniref:Acyl-[acyl-carrier-protein]--UDP-N-acetylglucosamine O-acyltransferase n=1 Tax=Kiritimatiella glycovorans TaxID=1307763 RepID=A0A0G3ECV6_9BACT|nr:acyl-ACP--UDP-N-acetylglucosamine O-acyltransferase [Kiritimatiella glycovorans]AKJ64153.1 Acyl-[acyl-carrier-protein]--UDP-N-acetylglucosamine O-acyltransferase [Kiritimatiella glycovorans]